MAMALAACSPRQRLSNVNPDGAIYFMEKVMFEIYQHFDDQDLIDVTFKLSNPTALITAHRLILSATSPYFKQLFKSEKGICPLIEIRDIDSETFERLIMFCYTGKTLVTVENVDRMLKAALVLQVDDVLAQCVDFLFEHMNDYTLERAYILEREAQCALLSEKMLEYEIKNFTSVTESAEFLNFETAKLQTILESDDLNVTTEKDAFAAVQRWYEHDATVRKQALSDIMSNLRLTQLDTNFIMKNIHPLPGCQFLALEALSWVNIPSTRDTISLRFTTPRPRIAEAFLAFKHRNGGCVTIFQYNENDDLWHKWIDIKIDVSSSRLIFMDDNLIFIGGTRINKIIDEVSSWNFKTKLFQRLPSMNQSRYRHCVVALNNKIYAIGGMGANDEILQSVEMYTASDGWKSINSMNTPRCNVTAVVLSGKIYVIGGRGGADILKSVECFDPSTWSWTQCADMNEKHSFAGASVHNRQIFVVGGWNGKENSSTVESYDPQRNEWTKICSLNIGRKRPSCISIYNQLWSVSGNGKKDVSVYDEQNDKWIDKKPMPTSGPYYGFTVPKYLL